MRKNDTKQISKGKGVESLAPSVQPVFKSTPKICLVDMEPSVKELLENRMYDCTSATLGEYVKAPKSRAGMENFIIPLVRLPPNLHEYEVAVVDLAAREYVELDQATAVLENVSGKATYALLSAYPEQVFNSKAFGASRFSDKISEMFVKGSILIAFASENEHVVYDIVKIGRHGNEVVEQSTCNSLRLCSGIGEFKSKHGKKIFLPEQVNPLSSVLGNHLSGAEYDVVFPHPTDWKNGQRGPSDNFHPLLLNGVGEIVAYGTPVGEGFLFVLPQIKNKAAFLEEFFDSLAEIFPKVFPYNGLFAWLNDGSYSMPGEQGLLQERNNIEEKYKGDVADNEAAIASLKDEFKFLRDMLSESGDPLVEAVQEYFKWLEFPSVKSMDEHNTDTLEEDIQVELENGILIIEVKGIGGTSKDKECAQISKIKNRRMEERQAFDVSALYVVNHQRYISPRSRINPPFTSNQIKDAQLDKRGLVTTFQLYNLYFDITSGLLTKDYVRKQLLAFGFVEFPPPDLQEVGVADEVFRNGTIAILNLSGLRISKGMTLLAKNGGSYVSRQIVGLQIDNVDVDDAENGEVGVQLDGAIKKGANIFMTRPSS